MTSALARAELFLLALVAFAMLSSLSCSLVARPALKAVRDWEPARRHTAALLLTLAPFALTALLSLSALLPPLLALGGLAVDHCLLHEDHHAHLCFEHWPEHAPHAWIWVGSAVALTWIAIKALTRLVELVRASGRLRLLLRTGELAAGDVTIVEAGRPFCATAGLLAPQVLVSRALLEGLLPAQRAAVIAHETCHVRRRDALLRLVASTAAAMYPASVRSALLESLELAAEQACDEEAARRVGDRLVVAETILRVERTMAEADESSAAMLSVGMHRVHIAERVESLVAAPQEGGRLVEVASVLCAAVGVLCAVSGWLHHTVESWLSPLLS